MQARALNRHLLSVARYPYSHRYFPPPPCSEAPRRPLQRGRTPRWGQACEATGGGERRGQGGRRRGTLTARVKNRVEIRISIVSAVLAAAGPVLPCQTNTQPARGCAARLPLPGHSVLSAVLASAQLETGLAGTCRYADVRNLCRCPRAAASSGWRRRPSALVSLAWLASAMPRSGPFTIFKVKLPPG